jgi:hypothetical protein
MDTNVMDSPGFGMHVLIIIITYKVVFFYYKIWH